MARSAKRWTMAAAAGLALLAAMPAAAQENDLGGFFIEVPVGLTMPVGEGASAGLYDPSLVVGVNLGYLFSLGGWSAAIGPAVDAHYGIGNVEDGFRSHDGGEDDLYLGRLRVIGGARFVVGFGSAFLFMRVGVGVDYVHASWDPPIYDQDNDDSDAAAGLVAGVGMGYMFTDLIGMAFLIDFPVGFHNADDDGDPIDWDDEMVDLETSLAVVFNL